MIKKHQHIAKDTGGMKDGNQRTHLQNPLGAAQ